MYQCWNEDPIPRPTFAEMVKQLDFLQKEEPDNIPLFESKSCEKLCDETPPNGFIQPGDETLMSAIIAHFHNTPPSSNSQPEEDNAHSQEGYTTMNPVRETNLLSQPEDNAHSQEGYITMNPVRETNLLSNLVIENGLNTVNSDHEYVNTPPHHTNSCEDSANISFPSNGLLRKKEHIQVILESNDSDYVPMHPASSTM